jgi:signal peptidase
MRDLFSRSLYLAAGLWLSIGIVAWLILTGYHGHLLSVQTASMVPIFGPGDAILVRPVAVHRLHPGDIISYRNSQNPAVVISHRLVRISGATGWLTTAGDTLLSGPDPAFPPRQLVGQVRVVAPGLGKVLDALHRPLGLVLMIYMPALTMIAAELRRLGGIYTQPFYSVRLRR